MKKILGSLSLGLVIASPFVSLDGAVAAEPSSSALPATSEPRRWTSERDALDGPTLDGSWFAGKRTVVYLVPDGARTTARRAAAAVMRDVWATGDWSLTHVFVSNVKGRSKFVLGRRVGLRDMAVSVTEETGQGPEFVPSNEERLRECVFFVHDPEASTWAELLGAEHGGTPAVVLLDGGKVVRVVELVDESDSANPADPRLIAEANLSADVRRLLPER